MESKSFTQTLSASSDFQQRRKTGKNLMPETAYEKTEVVVHQAHEVNRALESEVRRLQRKALLHGTAGILVTRQAPGRFTLELSREVPFGYTYEKA